MTTITLKIENDKFLPTLKDFLSNVKGVSIYKIDENKKSKTGIEQSLDDIKKGKVTKYKSVNEYFKKV